MTKYPDLRAKTDTAPHDGETWNSWTFYYETRGRSDGAQPVPSTRPIYDFSLQYVAAQAVPLGRPIPGAYNRLIGEQDELPIQENQPYSEDPGGLGGDHSYVHNGFYVGSVRSSLPTLFVDGQRKVIGDLQRPENREVENEFATTGFNYSRNAIFPLTPPEPIFFQNDDEPQDHLRSSRAFVNADGTPNEDGLASLKDIYGNFQSSSAIASEAFTEAKFDPVIDPLSIFNGDFEIGDNRGVVSSLFNGDELPGWNFQGGGGISIQNIVERGSNHLLRLNEGESATHNLFYVPQVTNLELSFNVALPNDIFPNRGGSVSLVLGKHLLG